MIKKGTWVEIEEIVLNPEDRAKNIPEETKITPLKCWIRGKSLRNCEIGEIIEVETNIGRICKGILVDTEPGYDYAYGKYVPELSDIGKQAREIISK